VTRILLDTGPLVAFLNRRDHFHGWATETLGALEPPLWTCESVLSEACFLLRGIERGPEAVLALVAREIVVPDFPLDEEAPAVAGLMKKYAEVPMALADACLVRMTELHRESAVLTLDGDFRIYRRNRREAIPLLVPEGLEGSHA
jgi:predicted nucleic acid-binding protein